MCGGGTSVFNTGTGTGTGGNRPELGWYPLRTRLRGKGGDVGRRVGFYPAGKSRRRGLSPDVTLRPRRVPRRTPVDVGPDRGVDGRSVVDVDHVGPAGTTVLMVVHPRGPPQPSLVTPGCTYPTHSYTHTLVHTSRVRTPTCTHTRPHPSTRTHTRILTPHTLVSTLVHIPTHVHTLVNTHPHTRTSTHTHSIRTHP